MSSRPDPVQIECDSCKVVSEVDLEVYTEGLDHFHVIGVCLFCGRIIEGHVGGAWLGRLLRQTVVTIADEAHAFLKAVKTNG